MREDKRTFVGGKVRCHERHQSQMLSTPSDRTPRLLVRVDVTIESADLEERSAAMKLKSFSPLPSFAVRLLAS